jgi:dTDP-4-amino-4,6-dideoxygalactose transaminase
MIPAVSVHFSADDRAEILAKIEKRLASGYLSQGENVDELEAKFAAYVGARHALTVSSGGAGLEAAMRTLKIAGKDVVIPTNTFFATAAAVLAAGGRVRLADIDGDTLSLSVKSLTQAITRETVGVIVVHIGGIISSDLLAIRDFCQERGLWLFEDCAHAHGSELSGRRAGTFGIGGSYSLFSTKVITAGEGGVVVTNDDHMAAQIRLLRDYGKPSRWISSSVQFGLNWRLNELAAIVGVAQLRRLDEFIAWRERIAALYNRELAGTQSLRLIRPRDRSSWYKYIVKLPPLIARERATALMRERGVELSGGVYEIPLHRQPVFAGQFDIKCFPSADEFCARHVCLPLYYGMKDDDARYVARTFKDVVAELSTAGEGAR